MDIILRNNFFVDLLDYMGDDTGICHAARVSTVGADAFKTDESKGLINFLMKGRHGSPFEHAAMKFRIKAPIFVWREFMRHRIGFSYNEQSGRYMELSPEFYTPPAHRPLVQVGKAGQYEFEVGSAMQTLLVHDSIRTASQTAWDNYQTMLVNGVAKEVARMVLPLNIYSSAVVTCNPRSMMAFLSLRTKVDSSLFPSYPQWEIERVATQMEVYFQSRFPLTYYAFCKHGRVSP